MAFIIKNGRHKSMSNELLHRSPLWNRRHTEAVQRICGWRNPRNFRNSDERSAMLPDLGCALENCKWSPFCFISQLQRQNSSKSRSKVFSALVSNCTENQLRSVVRFFVTQVARFCLSNCSTTPSQLSWVLLGFCCQMVAESYNILAPYWILVEKANKTTSVNKKGRLNIKVESRIAVQAQFLRQRFDF